MTYYFYFLKFKASKSIKPLLDEAVRVIPKEEIHLARITLKATAGLRLIPEKAAIKILKDIQHLFQKYPFKGHEDVSILDGKYEGIYSWLTLNYALSNFNYFDCMIRPRSLKFSKTQ